MEEKKREKAFADDGAARDEKLCQKVEDAICRRAKGYKVALKKTYKVKRVDYDPDTGKKTCEREELVVGVDEVHVPADLRAGTYWLNNRNPERWSEHPDSGDGGEPVGFVEIPAVEALDEDLRDGEDHG
ncbi:MAG: hypothetical protein E7661_10675 [Ruminococcaceae bacterium]|nr:hypothetical protein [Oscillospiraceae bacterium]